MTTLSKPSLRKAAAIAKELGVEVRIDPDGTIVFAPKPAPVQVMA